MIRPLVLIVIDKQPVGGYNRANAHEPIIGQTAQEVKKNSLSIYNRFTIFPLPFAEQLSYNQKQIKVSR